MPPTLKFFLVCICLLKVASGKAQTANHPPLFSLMPADTFNHKRFWLSAGTGAAVYSAISVALWKEWYSDYPLSGFHTFDDLGEWNNMDKIGHTFSAYTGCRYAFQGAQWTGMSRRKALWASAGIGLGIMSTIEVMDGFSENWGFSWSDMGFNILGSSLFVAQELNWQEQRVHLKISGLRPDYPGELLFSTDGNQSTTLDKRAATLYGTAVHQVILKDYNALTGWASFNISSFLKNGKTGKFPRWLNLAFGYGAGNLYGGFSNTWETAEGSIFSLDPKKYPRYRQFYLAPDIDLSRIPTRHRWLKSVLGVLGWIKIPAPALEWNTLGGLKVYPLFW